MNNDFYPIHPLNFDCSKYSLTNKQKENLLIIVDKCEYQEEFYIDINGFDFLAVAYGDKIKFMRNGEVIGNYSSLEEALFNFKLNDSNLIELLEFLQIRDLY